MAVKAVKKARQEGPGEEGARKGKNQSRRRLCVRGVRTVGNGR